MAKHLSSHYALHKHAPRKIKAQIFGVEFSKSAFKVDGVLCEQIPSLAAKS